MTVEFHRPFNGMEINPAQFYLVGPAMKLYFPVQVLIDSPMFTKVDVTFGTVIPPGMYELVCHNLFSCARADTNLFHRFRIREAQRQIENLYFSELMFAPGSETKLPYGEYIELFHKSDTGVNNLNFFMSDKKTEQKTVNIPYAGPNQYILICPENDREIWKDYENIIFMKEFPSLNNTTDTLYIFDQEQQVVRRTFYDHKMLREKSGQGYSLSHINGYWDCGDELTWLPSNDIEKGSPGMRNNIDESRRISYQIKGYNISEDLSIWLEFNQKISENDFKIKSKEGKSISFSNEQNKIAIHSSHWLKDGAKHEFQIYSKNCTSDILDTNIIIHRNPALKLGDIVINEILFNPFIGGSDFVEIYNTTNNYIDLKDISMANIHPEKGLENVKKTSLNSYLIGPESFTVLSPNIEHIKANYFTKDDMGLLKTGSLPSLNNNKGSLAILSDNVIIDHINYDEEMHLSWIDDRKGRSLERKNYFAGSMDRKNWSSASDLSGKATPGYKNSQFTEEKNITRAFSLLNKIISPNGDENADQLDILFDTGNEPAMADMKIYEFTGAFVGYIFQQITLVQKGMISWDTAINGSKIPNGIYILHIDSISESGKYVNYKIPFVMNDD